MDKNKLKALCLTLLGSFLSIYFSSDRFNYIAEIEKISNTKWDFLNSNGVFLVFFSSFLSFWDPQKIYAIYAIFINYISASIFFKLLKTERASLIGELYFLFFIFPLLSVQLKTSLGISLALIASIKLKSIILSFFSIASHFSLVFIYFITNRINTFKIILALILTAFLYNFIGYEKIKVYQEIYSLASSDLFFSFFNFKVIVVVIILIFAYIFRKKSINLSATRVVVIGIVTYYSFFYFPIFAHRLSELCFCFVPFLFKKTKMGNIQYVVFLILGSIIVFLGIIQSSNLWLVR